MRELDETVATAVQYAGDKSLIVVSGLANTGGLRLNAFSFAPDRGIAILGPSAAGVPALTWSTGPGSPGAEPGVTTLEAVAAKPSAPNRSPRMSSFLATGPGTEQINGFLDLAALNAILGKGM